MNQKMGRELIRRVHKYRDQQKNYQCYLTKEEESTLLANLNAIITDLLAFKLYHIISFKSIHK